MYWGVLQKRMADRCCNCACNIVPSFFPIVESCFKFDSPCVELGSERFAIETEKMKSEILFLKAGFLWAAFCVDDLMNAFCISGTSMSFLVNLGVCVYPIFLIVFPFLHSHRMNYHPQWCSSLVLSLTVLMLALPFLFFFVKFLVGGSGFDFADEIALLGMGDSGITGVLIYFLVCIVFVCRLLRAKGILPVGLLYGWICHRWCLYSGAFPCPFSLILAFKWKLFTGFRGYITCLHWYQKKLWSI